MHRAITGFEAAKPRLDKKMRTVLLCALPKLYARCWPSAVEKNCIQDLPGVLGAQHGFGVRVSVFGGKAEPAVGLAQIAGDARALFVHQAQ